jgi:hypothetical protein
MNNELEARLRRELYEKLADWSERFAILIFGSLVIQQLLSDASLITIIISLAGTGIVYWFAVYWLRRAKKI